MKEMRAAAAILRGVLLLTDFVDRTARMSRDSSKHKSTRGNGGMAGWYCQEIVGQVSRDF